MGFGKSVVALTAISELLADGVLHKVLVIAPVKVANTVWAPEADKWEHTHHLRINVATGSEKVRVAACEAEGDILVINFENLPWFFKKYGRNHGCDGLIVDELSRMKSSGGSQFKALRHKLPCFTWRVGMTGTPVSENYLGLFAQCMIVDSGARLGTNMEVFKRKYFYPTDYNGYNWDIREERKLLDAVADVVWVADDYTGNLPDLIKTTIPVSMPDQGWDVYTTLAKDGIAEGVEAVNAAVLSGKLQQIASGFLYGEDEGEVIPIHDAKIRVCQRLVDECRGNVIIAYWFQHDRDALQQVFPFADNLGGGVNAAETDRIIDRWNSGETKVLLVHPKTGGHGLQLEKGGADVIFYGPVWSRDLFDQLVARLWRRGQLKKVHVKTLVTVGTVDELVVTRSGSKKQFYERFTKHLKSV